MAVADRVNIKGALNIDTVYIDPRVTNTLERLNKLRSQKFVPDDISNGASFAGAKFNPLFSVLTKMNKEGRTSNKMFETLFSVINVDGVKAQNTIAKLKRGVSDLVSASVTGNSGQFKQLFDAYNNFFQKRGLGDLFAQSLRQGLLQADRDLKSFDAKVRKSNAAAASEAAKRAKQELDLESKRVKQREQTGFVTNNTDRVKSEKDRADQLARLQSDIRRRFAEQDEFERLYQKNQEKYSKDQQKRVAEELALEDRRLRARQKVAYDAVQADNKLNRQEDTKRVSDLRADIIRRLGTEQNVQGKQNLDLERATASVMEQQLKLQRSLNAAEAAGLDINNEQIRKARQFVNTDPRHIAMSRGAGQGGGGGKVPPISTGGPNDPFGDQYFNNISRGLDEQIKIKRAYDNSAFGARRFGEQTALAFKRYSAFVLGTFALQKVFNIFGEATQQVTEFDKNLTKLRQVTGSTQDDIESLGRTIFESAKQTGSGINAISEGLLIFAQAGFDSTDQLRKVSEILSQLPLTPSFNDIKSTADGLVAVFGQFGLGLGDTVSILDRFNFVAKETAIESQDLIEAASKSGSSFAAAGADLNKFIELTTLLRSKTRESASVVSTFFRTTLTKLQGTGSQDFLESVFGPDIRDLTVIEQLDKLAEKYVSLGSQQRNNLLAPIVDVRQLSRFGKLLEEINNEAIRKKSGETTVFDLIQRSAGSVAEDAQLAGDNLSTSFGRITASFADLLETLQRDDSVKKFVSGLADLSVALADVAKQGKFLLPIIAGLGALYARPRIQNFASGLKSSFTNAALVNRIALNRGVGTDVVRQAIATNTLGGIVGPGIVGGVSTTGGGLTRRQRLFGYLRGNAGALSTAAGIGGTIAAAGVFDRGGDRPSSGQNLGNNITQFGGIGVALGSVFGPLGIAIGGLTGATVGLIKATNENTKARQEKEADNFAKQIAGGSIAGFTNSLLAGLPTTGTSSKTVLDRRLGESFDVSVTKTFKDQADEFFTRITANDASKRNFLNVFKPIEEEQIGRATKDQIPDIQVRDNILSSFAKEFAKETGSKLSPNDMRLFEDALSRLTGTGDFRTLSEISKRVKDLRAESGQNESISFFRQLAVGLDSTVQSLRNFGEQIEAASDVGRKFSSVVSDFTSLVTPDLASSNRTLLEQNNLGGVFNLRDSFAQNFAKFAGNNELVTAVSDALEKGFGNTEESSQVATIQTFLTTGLTDVARGIAEPVLTAVQGALGPSSGLNDVLQLVNKLGNNAGEAADAITRTKDISELLAAGLRASAEALRAELEARSRLEQSILSLSDNIFEAGRRVTGATNTAQDRGLAQSMFTGRFGNIASQQNAAAAFLRRANTSSTPDVSGQLVQDNLSQINAVNRAAQVRSSGAVGSAEFQRSLEAQMNFNNTQQLFNQGLVELEDRIDNAGKAADVLREVFGQLRSNVIEAGQSVRQFSKRDFAVALTDLRKFGSASGRGIEGASLNKGFDALGPGGLDRVTGLLSLVGDFNLGNGLTGNQLSDQINAAFGAPAIAAAIGSFSGNKVSSSDIESQLQRSFQEQREAAKLESQLRQEQIRLLKVQEKVLNDTRNALVGQRESIDRLSSEGLPALESIRDKTAMLFTDKPQMVDMNLRPITAPTVPSFQNRPPAGAVNGSDVQHNVAVEPMLVNVKLFSDGILDILGPEIQKEIEAAISTKLSEVFADDPEKASKIASPATLRPNRRIGDDRSFGG